MADQPRPARKLSEVANLFLSAPREHRAESATPQRGDQEGRAPATATPPTPARQEPATAGRPALTEPSWLSDAEPAADAPQTASARGAVAKCALFVGGDGAAGAGRALALAGAFSELAQPVLLLHFGVDAEARRFLSGVSSLCGSGVSRPAELPGGCRLFGGAVELWTFRSVWSVMESAAVEPLRRAEEGAAHVLVSVSSLSCPELSRLARATDRVAVWSLPGVPDLLRAYRLIKLIYLANPFAAVDLIVSSDSAGRSPYEQVRAIVARFLQQPLGNGGTLPSSLELAELAAWASGQTTAASERLEAFCALALRLRTPSPVPERGAGLEALHDFPTVGTS